MKVLRQRKYLFALLALLVVFAACKGESPTAPTPGGGGGGGTGGGTPPTNASITLTVSNPNPLTSSTTVITATVTQGGNPVPNGTAVEFNTTLGTFTDTSTATTIKTTTNGVATATLTSPTAGTATVTANVNNVTQKTTVVFSSTPVTPPPPTSAPTITSISPTSGGPEGGQLITITGTNFRTPVRVLFDLGTAGGGVKDAFVGSVTPTQVQVIAPAVNLGAGQTLDAAITLINEAGTPSEVRVAAPSPFTYRAAQLTPKINAISPDSGPVNGGTRITIFGENFDVPSQVAFGAGGAWAQMQVISTTFNQIIAITPKATDVQPGGSGTLTGPVDLRVLNINGGQSATLSQAFRYTPEMQITGVRPLAGSSLGGTDVTIDGIGFVAPVDVFIGGVLAQTIRVSGTQILARTGPTASPCGGGAGPISVTNITDGATAKTDTLQFTYIGVLPTITGFTPTTGVTPGSTINVDVLNPGIGPLGSAAPKFLINSITVTPSPSIITQGLGTTTFSVVVPATGFTFPTVQCTTAAGTTGSQLGTVTTTITFNNTTTGCTTSLDNGLVVSPPGPNTCLAPPTSSVSGAPPCPAGFVVGALAVGTASAPQTFTISNAPSAADLTLGAPSTTVTGTGAATVAITPNTAQTVTAGGSVGYTFTVTPTSAGAFTGTITFTSNDPKAPTIQVCFSGSGV